MPTHMIPHSTLNYVTLTLEIKRSVKNKNKNKEERPLRSVNTDFFWPDLDSTLPLVPLPNKNIFMQSF